MNRKIKIFTAIVALSFLAGCANEQTETNSATSAPRHDMISGTAVAPDGDTVLIENNYLDLWGIEAPNLDNSDGWYSRAALDRFIGEGSDLVCIVKVKRKKRRNLAICSNSKVGDVGRAMLQNGWAVVNRTDKKSQDVDSALAGVYQRTEIRAREARLGLWVNYPLR
ncbi:MAG: thermonuclease family protein [Proteobacteria bacterium]|nr:thermonuclease family protein [Pseudomonadota bacterium]